jgi:hypothetical protein
MVASIALAAAALRAGLALRRNRTRRKRRTPELLRAHLRIAKPAVAAILIGFAAGPLSALWLRGWEPFGTFHSWIGGLVAALFVAVAVLGHRLERGRGRPVDAHAIAGGVAVLLAAVSAVAGFVLLP